MDRFTIGNLLRCTPGRVIIYQCKQNINELTISGAGLDEYCRGLPYCVTCPRLFTETVSMILKVSNNSEWKLCNYLRDTFNIAKTLLV